MNKKEILKLISIEKYHYVYILCRPNGEPFYVGKGCNQRIFDHESEATRTTKNEYRLNVIRKIFEEGKQLTYKIDSFFDVENDAFEREIDLIEEIGRADLGTGLLTNLDGGGNGGSSVWSEETKQKRLKNFKKNFELDPNFGDRWRQGTLKARENDPTIIARISKTLIKTYQTTDLANQLSKTHKQRNEDPEVRRQNSEAQTKVHAERPELRIQQGKKRSKTFKENPEIVENIGKNRRQFNIDNPEQYKINQQRAIDAAKTPEARSKNSQKKVKWFQEEPIKVEQRNEKIKETTQSEEFREAASERNKLSHNTPEAKQNISAAQKKRFEDPEQRKNARKKTLENASLKKSIKVRIQSLIQSNNLTNIHIPDGRASIKKFQGLENSLLQLFP